MVSQSFLQQVKRRNLNKNGKLKRLKKPPKWLFPLTPERKYLAELYSFTLEIRKVISNVLLPKIPIWLAGATISYPDPVLPTQEDFELVNTLTHHDSLIDDIINEINDSLILVYELLLPKQTQAQNFATFIGLEIAAFNQIQYLKTTNSVLGVDIFLEEPWLEPQLELFSNQNAQLISNMTVNEVERVSGYIQRGLQDGTSFESIAELIEKSFGITRRHAKLIARDQSAKLNGSLTKLRQQEVGIQEFVWQTAGDERVRPDHRVLDGKLCKWNDPTVYFDESTNKWEKRSKIGGTLVQPSQDVNCRCVAVPHIEGLFN